MMGKESGRCREKREVLEGVWQPVFHPHPFGCAQGRL